MPPRKPDDDIAWTTRLAAALPSLHTLLERAETHACELVSDEARAAVRDDLPEAITFIRGSTQKMDRLINAILRLSREGQRIITPEPLNMAALLGGVADGVRHLLDAMGAASIPRTTSGSSTSFAAPALRISQARASVSPTCAPSSIASTRSA